MQQQRNPKINFGEIFRVVRFSTFATISALFGHAETACRCPFTGGKADIPPYGRDFWF
jgi:hypothetical protein